jgi:hypothetical protein
LTGGVLRLDVDEAVEAGLESSFASLRVAWSLGELIRLDSVVLVETKNDGVVCDTAACAESGCKQPARRA